MKNKGRFLFKKAFLAILMVTILVSSIVTVSLAAGAVSYKGNLSTAKKKLETAQAAKTVEDKSTLIAAVYTYLTDATSMVDPSTDGYDEFLADYNETTFRCGLELYANYEKQITVANKTNYLAKVYAHFVTAPLFGVEDFTITVDGDPSTLTFSAFETEINVQSFSIAEELFNNFNASISFKDGGALQTIGYEGFLMIYTALRDFIDNAVFVEYEAPAHEEYTGSLSTVESMLKSVSDETDYETLKTVLANVYTYLVTTPVDPTTDSYADVYEIYSDLCVSLKNEMFGIVDNAVTVEDKIKELNTIKEYLTATPITESFVTAFNEKVENLKTEYQNASDVLSSSDLVVDKETVLPPVNYAGTVEDFSALVDAIDLTDDIDVASVAVFAAYDYLIETTVDPSEDGYAEAVSAYVEKRDGLIALYFEIIDNEPDPAEKVLLLTSKVDFVEGYNGLNGVLEAYPLSKAAIDKYNEKLAEVKKICDDALVILKEDNMVATFVPVESLAPNASIAMLNQLLSDVKACTTDFEAKKAAMTSLYRYLTTAVCDLSSSDFGLFANEYITVRADFTAELIATIDNAEASKKVDAVKAVSDYLAITPYEKAAVVAFNNKIDELVTADSNLADTLNPLKATCFIIEIENGIEALGNTEDMSEKMDILGTVYKTAMNARYDYTDEALMEVSLVLEEAIETFETDVEEYIDIQKSADDKIAAIIKVRDFINANPVSSTIFDKYNAKLSSTITTYTNVSTLCENEDVAITSVLEIITKKFDAVKAIEDLDGKIAEFKNLYDYIKESVIDPSDSSEFVAAYEKFCTEYTNELMNSLNQSVPSEVAAQLYKVAEFIKSAPFSETVIDEYNDAYTAILNKDYEGALETLQTTFPAAFVYNAPAGLVSDFTAVNALVTALEDGGADELVALYNYLANNTLNVGNDLYAGIIEMFASKKVVISEQFIAAIDAISEINAYDALAAEKFEEVIGNHKDAFVDMYDFITSTYMSESMVNEYNEKLESVIFGNSSYSVLFEAAQEIFESSMYKLHNHMDICPIDSSKVDGVRYNSLVTTLDQMEYTEILGLILSYELVPKDSTTPVTSKSACANRINSYISLYTNPGDYDASLTIRVAEIKEEVSELIAEAKEELVKETPLTEYEIAAPTLYENFNDGIRPWKYAHEQTNPGVSATIVDGYVNFEHDSQKVQPEPFFDIKMGDTTKGFVIEFDLTYHKNSTLVQFYLACSEDGLLTGARVGTDIINILNGDLCIRKALGGSFEPIAEDVFGRGEWTHFIFVYDPETFSMKLYVNYELIEEYALYCAEPVILTTLRIGVGTENRQASMDNLVMYQGTAYRDYTKFDNMSDADKFNYYVEYFADESISISNRNKAFQYAKALAEKVKDNPSCKDSYDFLRNYDYNTEILGSAREENIGKIMDMYSNLSAVTTSNMAEVQNQLDELQTFMDVNYQFIDQTDERYVEIVEAMETLSEDIVYMNNVKNFVDTLKRFDRATTLASMAKHRASAETYYNICRFDVAGNYDRIADDPVVVSFLALIEEDSLLEYYDSMLEVIEDETKKVNSKRIIDCIEFIEKIEGYDPDAESAEKQAFWRENYEYINKYISIIRGVADNCDLTYPGIDEAFDIYDEMNEFFFGLLQSEHIAVIKAQLERYPQTDSYIEKRGICTFIDKYIAENDIDYTLDEIKLLLSIHKVYSAEVEVHKNEYQALVEQNTTAFIAIVERMNANANDFAILNELLEKATKDYYYNMNVDSEDADLKAELDVALETFEYYAQHIEFVKSETAKFLESAEKLTKASTRQDIYKALTECAKTFDNVDTDAGEGVEEAMTLYTNKLTEYTEQYAPANDVVSEANGFVCSVRSMSVAEIVLSAIKSIFTK